MISFSKGIDRRSWYFFGSVLLILFFPMICRFSGDGNLPPQKNLARLWINPIFLNLLLAYALIFLGRIKSLTISKAEWMLFAAAGVALCALPPIFSGDLHEYLMRGRILGVYHENPYLVPKEYPADPFYALTVWVGLHKLPENYGPVWASLQGIAPTLFQSSYWASVFFFKLMLFMFLAGSVWFFHRIAGLIWPEQARWMTPLFALNPNLIDHILIDGHNDIVMVFLILCAFYFLLKNRYYWAVAAATLAVLIKFTAVIFLPVMGIYYFRRQTLQSLGSFLSLTLKSIALFLLISFVFYFPYWVGMSTLSYFSKFSDWFATNSVPYAVHAALNKLGITTSELLVKRFFSLFFVVNCLAALGWFWLRKEVNAKDLCRTVSWMFMAMFLSYTIPFYGHHLLWMLPFLVLSGFSAPILLCLLFATAGIFFYFKRLSFLFLIGIAAYVFYLLILRFNTRNSPKEPGFNRKKIL